MNKTAARPCAAALAALLTLTMLSGVQALFGGAAPAPEAVYGSGDPDGCTQVVVVQGKRIARS